MDSEILDRTFQVGATVAFQFICDLSNSIKLTNEYRVTHNDVGNDYWFVDGRVFAIFDHSKSYCLFDREIGGLFPYLDLLSRTASSLSSGVPNVASFPRKAGHLAPALHQQFLSESTIFDAEEERQLQSANISFLTNIENWEDTYFLSYCSGENVFSEGWIAPQDSEQKCDPPRLSVVSTKDWIEAVELFRNDLKEKLRELNSNSGRE